MIRFILRRCAFEMARETGRSLQDCLSEIVSSLQNGIIQFRKRPACPICGHAYTRVRNMVKYEDKTIRYHRCAFCGAIFRSIEKKD